MKSILRKSTIQLISGVTFAMALLLAPISSANAQIIDDGAVTCYCTNNGRCATGGTGGKCAVTESTPCFKMDPNCDGESD